MGPRGDAYWWYPFHGKSAPDWLTAGGWLGGGRLIHFALAWALGLNGLLYVAYFFASGEWRRRVFLVKRDLGNAIETAKFYLRIRKTAPEQGLYNGLQRFGYTSAIALGVIEVLSGLAIYKPVQLRYLTALFGGYDSARAIHFLGLVSLGLFVLGHVLMVALHPRTLLAMVTGGKKS